MAIVGSSSPILSSNIKPLTPISKLESETIAEYGVSQSTIQSAMSGTGKNPSKPVKTALAVAGRSFYRISVVTSVIESMTMPLMSGVIRLARSDHMLP